MYLAAFKDGLCGFHSISFPSEWGVNEIWRRIQPYQVSIQLVSPASGETPGIEDYIRDYSGVFTVSIQLVSPASGETVEEPSTEGPY